MVVSVSKAIKWVRMRKLKRMNARKFQLPTCGLPCMNGYQIITDVGEEQAFLYNLTW